MNRDIKQAVRHYIEQNFLVGADTPIADGDSLLQLQIVDSATAYENYISYGAIQISSVEVTLPIAAQAKPFTPPTAGVGASAGPPQDLGDLLWPSY